MWDSVDPRTRRAFDIIVALLPPEVRPHLTVVVRNIVEEYAEPMQAKREEFARLFTTLVLYGNGKWAPQPGARTFEYNPTVEELHAHVKDYIDYLNEKIQQLESQVVGLTDCVARANERQRADLAAKTNTN
tara:strand:- start:17536 stop:17928 length:393 start_codon:yes stop_codon:yes gene_type:complete